MEFHDPIDARQADFTKFIRSEKDLAALQQHLKEIIEGPAFRGSQRSGQFLNYIVKESVAGHFDLLKERLIGVELFGRPRFYDTGEDAIVRVAASDVRRRLLQHYGGSGAPSEFRLSLPLGSYIPEITRYNGEAVGSVGFPEVHDLQDIGHFGTSVHAQSSASGVEEEEVNAAEPVVPPQKTFGPAYLRWTGLFFAGIAVIAAIGWGIDWNRAGRLKAVPAAPASSTLWSNIMTPSHPTHLITSDPNIDLVQEITGSELTLSDYANHKYIPASTGLTQYEIQYCQRILAGDSAASAVDPPIAMRIGALAAMDSGLVDARPARSIQLPFLKADDNFIFLGSPRSNPWTSLFDSQLDFRFVFDKATKQEIIVNSRQRPNEVAEYIPTAEGAATGQSFAIIAFVQTPDSNGRVLILAGANEGGTEAAGRFVTDLPELFSTLQGCGINPRGPISHFEVLLRLNTMAGSSSHVDVAACHILMGSGSHS